MNDEIPHIADSAPAGGPKTTRGHRGEDSISAAIGRLVEKTPRPNVMPVNPSYLPHPAWRADAPTCPGAPRRSLCQSFRAFDRLLSDISAERGRRGRKKRGGGRDGAIYIAAPDPPTPDLERSQFYISIFVYRMGYPDNTMISVLTAAHSSR